MRWLVGGVSLLFLMTPLSGCSDDTGDATGSGSSGDDDDDDDDDDDSVDTTAGDDDDDDDTTAGTTVGDDDDDDTTAGTTAGDDDDDDTTAGTTAGDDDDDDATSTGFGGTNTDGGETTGGATIGPSDTGDITTTSGTGGPPLFDLGPGLDCNTYDDTCPRGDQCMPFADDGGDGWNALGCFEITGDDQVGDACTTEGVTGIDSCAQGSMCFFATTEDLNGICVAFCDGSPAAPICEDPDSVCAIANEGVINICLPACDPLLQDCPENAGCYPINDDFVCATDASDGAGPGDPCEFINGCSAGSACIGPEALPDCFGAGCCAEFCDTMEPDACEGGTECVAWYEEGMAPPGDDDIGICSLPI